MCNRNPAHIPGNCPPLDGDKPGWMDGVPNWMETIPGKSRPEWIPWPKSIPRRFNTGTACDMLMGPCACGATHTAEEAADALLKQWMAR